MININVFQFSRWCIPVILHYLNKIKPENKAKIKFNILTEKWKGFNKLEQTIQYMQDNAMSDLNYEVVEIWKGFNYLAKTKWSCEQDSEYTVKLDEDCFINNHVWDYMIENISILDDNNILFFAPALSIGIPTTEYFIESFFTDKEKEEIYNMFLAWKFNTEWGVDYSGLNKYTIDANVWNAEGFYNSVNLIGHWYRGVHPVRFSYDAHAYILDKILDKIDLFKQQQEYKTVLVYRPYFCNSLFAIKTETYRKIYKSDNLFKDGLDEVPLNLYMKRDNLQMAFIENSFGIHMTYRACKDDRIGKLESDFYKEFERRAICS